MSTRVSIVRLVMLVCAATALSVGCAYTFSEKGGPTPFPEDIDTVSIKSATNNTTITGIETELTNNLRAQMAMGSKLKPVRSNGDAVLETSIESYEDTPATYKADGKELTRIGTLKVACRLDRRNERGNLWKKRLTASRTYNVTETAAGTLDKRRAAISEMIEDLVIRIHRSLYEDF